VLGFLGFSDPLISLTDAFKILLERCEVVQVYGFTCSNCRTMTTGGDEASDVTTAGAAGCTTLAVGATLTATYVYRLIRPSS